MERHTLRDAQDHLSQLLDAAQGGKTILILDEHEHAVQLVPVAASGVARKPGSARGKIRLAPDFDQPLPDFGEYME